MPPRDKPFVLAELQLRVSTLGKPKTTAPVIVEAEALLNEMKIVFREQVMGIGMKLAHVHKGSIALQLEVCGMRFSNLSESGADTGETPSKSQFSFEPEIGMFADKLTELKFVKTDGIQIKGQAEVRSASKMIDVSFEKLGIGGLDNEFRQIFRRAFASRVYPPDMVANMGLNHVKGLMLFGPPGCGKTLIARQISKALQGDAGSDKHREPKVVNGPEILSKFVGESEKNIRELFADAEREQKEAGDDSELHVIIFDEIDAIAKARGSHRDGTGVHDSLVNQLLSKIDGVDALNNVLLIGMTNRLDMIDPALLRPGRFEVQVEISLPDENGRVQILNIHTSKMRKAGYLSPSVDIQDLAQKTKNFTGAEIEGLVKGAAAYAFNRQVNLKEDLRKVVDAKSLMVQAEDFEAALKECKPQFGSNEAEDEMRRTAGNGVIPFSREFENVSNLFKELAMESASSTNAASTLALVSVLLCGEPGSGKTALAAKVAYESGFPLVRVLSPDKYIGMSEQSKSAAIADAFDEAYKSEKSLILLEDIERLIDYTRLGPRFSNQVLQTLLILIRKPPPKKGRRLFIVGTTSIPELIQPLDLVGVFNMVLHVPQVKAQEEVYRVVKASVAAGTSDEDVSAISRVCPLPISVKKLLLALDMAQKDGGLNREKFSEFLALG
jgi:vesicle-fusing ATPase